MGEKIIIQDDKGKKYTILRVLEADTKKIIDDLSKLNISLKSDLYEANNRIADLMDIIDERDKIIDLMANEIYIEHNPHFNTVEDVKEYFEERCKDAENKS